MILIGIFFNGKLLDVVKIVDTDKQNNEGETLYQVSYHLENVEVWHDINKPAIELARKALNKLQEKEI